jgi:hypothetical protein
MSNAGTKSLLTKPTADENPYRCALTDIKNACNIGLHRAVIHDMATEALDRGDMPLELASKLAQLMRQITHVAVIYEGQVWSLPEPFRHHDIIRTIANLTGATSIDCDESKGCQGFLDASGRYLSRVQALPVALACKQVKDENDICHGMLFSEDLW